ncbi:MAG: FkbM family methyltransferase [Ignavibacteriaceae bacterium]
MIKILKTKFAPLFKLLKRKEYYRYLFLLGKYFNHPRLKVELVSFLNFRIFAVDCLSFVFQFKEIFLQEVYKFDCEKSEPVIIDCGANIGVSCLYFKKLHPNSKIKAFEADTYIAGLLKKNLEMNGFQDIEIVSKAVWINNSGVEFGSDGADGGSVFNSSNKKLIPSIRLKDIIDQEKEVDFLKIDIEGAETDVLADCDGSLLKAKRIFVEYHSWIGVPQNLDKLLNTLSNNNFRYYVEHVNTINSPLEDLNKIPDFNLQLNIYAVRMESK